jgi:hypothetical protein
MDSSDLSKPLGSLPPMKIHCGEMVEGALREALRSDSDASGKPQSGSPLSNNTLLGDLNQPMLKKGKLKVVKLDD